MLPFCHGESRANVITPCEFNVQNMAVGDSQINLPPGDTGDEFFCFKIFSSWDESDVNTLFLQCRHAFPVGTAAPYSDTTAIQLLNSLYGIVTAANQNLGDGVVGSGEGYTLLLALGIDTHCRGNKITFSFN